MGLNAYIDIAKKVEKPNSTSEAVQVDHGEQASIGLAMAKRLAEDSEKKKQQLAEAAPQLRPAYNING